MERGLEVVKRDRRKTSVQSMMIRDTGWMLTGREDT